MWGKFKGSTIETELELSWLVLLKLRQNELFWEQCLGPGPSLDMCISVYAKSISWGWLMQKTNLSWSWPNRGYCESWLMAKSWVEGGCYKEYTEKWGWMNKERERTKVKWLKNQLKEKWNKKNTLNTSKKRKELLTQMNIEGKIARWKNMRNWGNKMIENGMFSRYVKEGKKSLKYT